MGEASNALPNHLLGREAILERITVGHTICHGKPTIRGLRYPVETILELLSAGMTYEEILADYEDLEREDFLAALAYAARLSQVERIEMLAAGCSSHHSGAARRP